MRVWIVTCAAGSCSFGNLLQFPRDVIHILVVSTCPLAKQGPQVVCKQKTYVGYKCLSEKGVGLQSSPCITHVSFKSSSSVKIQMVLRNPRS